MPGELDLPLISPLPGGAMRETRALLETCAPAVVQILTVARFARHLKENLTSVCSLLVYSVLTFPRRAKIVRDFLGMLCGEINRAMRSGEIRFYANEETLTGSLPVGYL